MTKNQTYAMRNRGAVLASYRAVLLLLVLTVAAWGNARAEEGVTVIATAPASTPTPSKSTPADGTPVVHKSAHKKKHPATETASTAAPTTPAAAPASSKTTTAAKPEIVVGPAPAHPQLITAANPVPPVGAVKPPAPPVPSPSKTVVVGPAPAPDPVPPAPAPVFTPAGVPTIETGLPVARYPGMGAPIQGVSTYIPKNVTLPGAKPAPATPHQPIFASAFPSSVIPATSTAAGLYSSPSHPSSAASSDFVFTNYKKAKNTYPWKTGIITTMFWIGEGSTPISSTTNIQSSWDEDWMSHNRGSDSPYNRNGYASGSHASTLNPFYIALPFNDLAFPDKAREWVPRSWHRPNKDGKQVSACKDRWVLIKNAQGRSCYAQWEDVGPLRYDHAEYVFGSERPIGLGDDHAGLDVSPAVAQYLGIDGKNRITAWRFVDDEDVRPGPWLLLDEQAVLYEAMHQLKNSSPSELPIQRATEPIDDSSNVDSNKKKVDASKG